MLVTFYIQVIPSGENVHFSGKLYCKQMEIDYLPLTYGDIVEIVDDSFSVQATSRLLKYNGLWEVYLQKIVENPTETQLSHMRTNGHPRRNHVSYEYDENKDSAEGMLLLAGWQEY